MRKFARLILICMFLTILLPAPLLFFSLRNAESSWGKRILQPHLHGVVLSAERPVFYWPDLFSGVYQEKFSGWFNQRFALREFFIRTNNQLYYALFDKTYMGDVLIGSDEQLYGRGYVDEYCGHREPLPLDRQAELVSQMAFVQQKLQKRGITFLVVVTPSKPDVLPGSVPDGYCGGKVRKPRNVDQMIPLMQAQGIHFVDGQKLTVAAQQASSLPLFCQGGLHWNALGTVDSVNVMLTSIGQLRGVDADKLRLAAIPVNRDPVGADRDLANVLNLIAPRNHYVNPQPEFQHQHGQTGNLSVFMVGGSFSWLPLEQINEYRLLNPINFHFYYRGQHVLYADGRQQQISPVTRVETLNFTNYVLRHDVIILEINVEAFGYDHARDFLRDMVAQLDDRKTSQEGRSDKLYMLYGAGWHGEESVNGLPFRWIDGGAQVLVYSDQPAVTDFSMEIQSFFRPRSCEIYLNDRLVHSQSIKESGWQPLSWQGNLKPGANLLRIVSAVGAEAPADVTKSDDTRKLAFRISGFNIHGKSNGFRLE